MNNELYHHGVLGMKWGIRRYQNKDGSLTALGRKKLGMNDAKKSKNRFNDDIVISKGTKSTRVIYDRDVNDADYYDNPEIGYKANKAKLDKAVKDAEDKLITKYISVDENRNGGVKGDEFYVSWFTMEGFEPNGVFVDEYIAKNDLKIASGQKIVDAVLKEYGDLTVADFKRGVGMHKLSMEYTTNRELHNKINKELQKMGYDGVEDINDLQTDLPLIIFDSKKSLKRTNRTGAADYIRKHIEPNYTG